MDHFLTYFLDFLLWNNIISSIKHKAGDLEDPGSKNGFICFIELKHRTTVYFNHNFLYITGYKVMQVLP